MKKVRKTLPIVIPAFAILGILAVSGHAKKPSPLPEPTVTVTGAIEGTGDPEAIRVTFDESLVYEYPGDDATQGPVFISNPDYPPSLKIVLSASAPPRGKYLKYYYCVHKDHVGSTELKCSEASHSPDYYYCLEIHGGISQKKGRAFDHVVFPVDSPWNISWKKDDSIVVSDRLKIETKFDVIK